MSGAHCPETDLDLWSDELLRNPYDAYAALRRLGPVVWMPRYEAYAVARYDEVRAVLQDWRRFSSAKGVGLSEEMNGRSGRGILTTDPPLHDSRRRVLTPQLLPAEVSRHQAFLDRFAADLVAGLVSKRRFDAVTELAHPYSVTVVADLVGLPSEGRDRLIERASAAFNTFGPDNDLNLSSRDGFRQLFEYCTDVATPDRLTPDRWGAGIYAAGARGEIEPEACPGLMLAYAWAGMDTTVNAVSAAVSLFADHPDQWDLLRSDRSLIPAAANEVLRIEPPVQRFTRYSTTDTELGGIVIPEGSRLAVLFGAANRDESHYPEPDRFDITRNPSDHLSFGRGVHRCVGAPLALQEMYSLFDAMADRIERFTMLERTWRLNNALHGLEQAVVEVTLSDR